VEIVRDAISLSRLTELSDLMFGGLVKAVVDVRLGLMVVGGELHSDEEALLISEGSTQTDLWGINLYPDQFGTPDSVEFDSMVNIRPGQGNRSRSVEDPEVQASILAIVARLVS
jgi:hypothetical protein